MYRASSTIGRTRALAALRLATCLLFVALAATAHADVPAVRVYPDEYVVEWKPRALSESPTESDLPRYASRPLGAGAALVTTRATRAFSHQSPAPVPLDPSHLAFCERLLSEGSARSCAPNFELRVSSTPNDPLLSQQWGLTGSHGIDAPRAWDRSQGSTEVVIAVIDTGVDYTHPDLQDNMWVNGNEIPDNHRDDDQNGYIDDVHGINTLLHSGDPKDDNGHGTHVAGIIGARGENRVGVTGVAWYSRLMALKFLSNTGAGSLAGAVEALNYVVTQRRNGVNVRVINASWGGGLYSQVLYDAIARANDEGILFIAAAGNDGYDNDESPTYPASFELPNVVSVASIDSRGVLSDFSNYGVSSVRIAAPGSRILSTIKGGEYQTLSGTSMASPFVAGAFALLFSLEPHLSHTAAITRLYDSARRLSSLSGVVEGARTLDVGRLLYGEKTSIPAVVTQLTAIRSTGTGRVRTVGAFEPFSILLSGTGTGYVELRASFNGVECSGSKQVYLENGAALVALELPRLSPDFRTLSFQSSLSRARIRLSPTRRAVRAARRISAASSRFHRACAALLAR